MTRDRQPASAAEPNSKTGSAAGAQGGRPGADSRQSAPVAAPSISLPKGGGAIHGIGEKLAANPVTGTGSLSVPIALSPGRSGFQPQLTLSYDSGAGNGPFGLGWNLGLPAISRKTDKGLPRYADHDQSDVFLLSGAEDLVPLLVEEDGTWERDGEPRAAGTVSYRVERFRPRTEGLFARIERWTDLDTGEKTHWRSISPDNVTSLYGKTDESRIADPERPERVFSWLICASYDDKGNVIVYQYAREDGSSVVLAQAHERSRTPESRSANRYLKRIKYGNALSRLAAPALYRELFELGSSHLPAELAALEWHFEVVFDYDQGHCRPPAENQELWQASVDPAQAWTVRRDPFSVHRPGFEVRTYRLCRRILMFHHFPAELETANSPRRHCLVRSTELEYQEGPVASFITAVTQAGYVRQGNEGNKGYLRRTLPALELGYSRATLQEEVREVDPKSLENLPGGLDGSRSQWIDLDGEGLTGILTEQADAWFYKRNLSPLPADPESEDQGEDQAAVARFGALEPVGAVPSSAGPGAGSRLLDLAGDGQLDLVHLERQPLAGFYERTPEAGWERFRPFASCPNVAWDNPNLRFVDLTGDGHADVLIAEDEVFTWYASLAEDGFGDPHAARFAADEEEGPRLVFAEGTQSVYLADFSGDGLADLVRIRNGEICYWPNLGYGRFGARVTMDNAPWFEEPDLFDQRRIRLADVDGSGVTDVVYLGSRGVDLYFNQSGNAWSEARTLTSFPPVDNLSSVMVVDLLGNGTACLVWSSTLPGEARRPMRYIDLMGGQKPHLLVTTNNNLGAETEVHYAPSTRFYLEDKAAGTPWITRLPFPVHVVERVETRDRISRSRFVTRYTYHHGYFDGHEREFRGFGRVDQWDTEEYAVFEASGELEDVEVENLDAASHLPPVLTRTWFHTGAYPERTTVSRQLAGEYYGAPEKDRPGYEAAREAFEATLLADSILPATVHVQDGGELPWDLSAKEQREACRALRGTMLRQEVYALDGTPESVYPYTVSEQNASLEMLQPRAGNHHAVFMAHPRETLAYHYERDPDDPRIAHQAILDVDRFGNVRQAVAVGYGRQTAGEELAPEDREKQDRILVTATWTDYTNEVDVDDSDATRDAYRVPLPWQNRTYEVTQESLEPSAESPWHLTPGGERRFGFEELRTLCESAAPIEYHQEPNGGLEKRLIEHGRTRLRRDDLSGPLPFGELGSLALPYQSYQLAFTPGLTLLYDDRVSEPFEPLLRKGHYVQLIGHPGWWIPSGQVFYSLGENDATAQELGYAESHFFLPHRFLDPFGETTKVTYDTHDLLIAATEDPLGNTATAEHDYRVLGPRRMTGPNGNRSEVAFDALGLVVGTAVRGKESDGVGDSLEGFRADLPQDEVDDFFTDPKGLKATELLGDATTRIVYDVGRYQRLGSGAPPFAAALARETHAGDPDDLRIQTAFTYSDGFGREIQQKVQAEPGPVTENGPDIDPRWVGSGWAVLNNKGKPVKQYEPFFDDTHDFRFGKKVGVSPTLFYDPVGRVVATLHPNHTYEKVMSGPWRQETWDVNDTVRQADPRDDPDVGGFFLRLPEDDFLPTWYTERVGGNLGAAEQGAADKAAVHDGTPGVAFFDSLGRPFLSVTHNRFERDNATVDERYTTRTELDVEGNPLRIIDARGNVVMEYRVEVAPGRFVNAYDVAGRQLYQKSMDAGARWTLSDVAGNPIYAWDSRDHRFGNTYDALRRPIHLWVKTGDDAEMLAERTVYGEGHDDAEELNLRGKIFLQLDGAGLVTSGAYDFKGNLLHGSRRLAREYRERIDWQSVEAALAAEPLVPATIDGALDSFLEPEPETFTASTTYDALNRVVTQTTPDGSVNRPSYNEANLLERVDVRLRGAAEWTPFALNVDYDAKGQRMNIVYGCGVESESEKVFTEYTYDELTFRLTRLRTVRPGDGKVLQNLSYAYDPVGNITSIRDDAQQTVFYNNTVVEPHSDYTYDAEYRLIRAAGREHAGQSSDPAHNHPEWKPHYDSNDSTRTGLVHPHDGGAMRDYFREYGYDAIGNIQTFTHSPKGGSRWTRHYQYEENSNRLVSTSLPGEDPENTGGKYGSLYDHDEHGNMTSMPHLPIMRWDFEDQLQATARQVVPNGGTPETTYYVYDAAGERVRKVTEAYAGSGETPTRMSERIYVGGFEIYREYDGAGTGTLERETLHVMDDTRRIALVETRTETDASPSQLTRYQFGNHLDSAGLELDDGAQIISYEEYYPYGSTSYQAVRSQTETSKRYRYTGKERDEESGLYYHGARYYAAWLGRWTAADPAGLVDGANLFQYGRSSPLIYRDTSGTAVSAGRTYPDDVVIRLPSGAIVRRAEERPHRRATWWTAAQGGHASWQEGVEWSKSTGGVINVHASVFDARFGPDVGFHTRTDPNEHAAGKAATFSEWLAEEFALAGSMANLEVPDPLEEGKAGGSPVGKNPDSPARPWLAILMGAVGIAAALGGAGPAKSTLKKALKKFPQLKRKIAPLFTAARKVEKLDDALDAIRDSTPLTEKQKDIIRDAGRMRWRARYKEGKVPIPKDTSVHHLIPLEYAHLFRDMDPNALHNLVRLTNKEHRKIDNLWTKFRTEVRKRGYAPTQAEVLGRAMEITRKINNSGVSSHYTPHIVK